MSKISVVIPTMWKGEYIEQVLNNLQNLNRVDEIIIIDNSPMDINVNISIFSKVVHIKMESNIFVNPAWNLGTKLAKNEIISLMQDDVFFNTDFFETIEIEDDCLIGVSVTNYPPSNFSGEFRVEYNPQIVDCYKREWGYATLLMYKKSSYIEIPDDLKIWCGDDFLFEKFKKKMSIDNLPIKTRMSTTSDLPFFNDVKDMDVKNYEKYK